jgi:hypothetical protein
MMSDCHWTGTGCLMLGKSEIAFAKVFDTMAGNWPAEEDHQFAAAFRL